MKLSLSTRGAVVLVGTAAVTVMATGVSYAVWSVTGSGTGTASATTAQALTVSPVTPANGLHPGGSASGSVTISNSNPFAVRLTALTFAAPTVDTAHAAGCTNTDVLFSSQVSPTNAVVIPGKVGSTIGTAQVTFTAAMGPASSDGCQGATFSAAATATGTS